MIRITRFDGKCVVLNAEWIQFIETTPDTLITLTTGEKILVRNSLQEVVEEFLKYKSQLFSRKELATHG